MTQILTAVELKKIRERLGALSLKPPSKLSDAILGAYDAILLLEALERVQKAAGNLLWASPGGSVIPDADDFNDLEQALLDTGWEVTDEHKD